MASSSISNVSFIVKQLYADKGPENLVTRKRTLLSKLRKRGGFTGSQLNVPVKYGNPQGVSGTFATAKANAGQTSGIAWVVTRKKSYGFATIDAESMEATGDNKGAFMELVESEIDGTLDEVGRRHSLAVYGDGSGAIGRCANNPADTNGTITLSVAADAKNFAKGQKLVASDTKTGGSLRDSGAAVTVTAVSRGASTSTVTFSGTITGLTTNDYLYNEGSYDTEIIGLEKHLPLAAADVGSLYSVDRSVDVERLGGQRLDQSSYPIEENFLELGAMIHEAGGSPDFAVLNPANFSKVVRSTMSKTEQEPGGTGDVGFQYITLHLPSGPCKLYSDPDCPANRGYLLQMDSWVLRYLGKGFPHIVTDDGQDRIRQTDADGIEVRIRSWANLYCTAPAWNGVLSVA
jgi:hypothetical protein